MRLNLSSSSIEARALPQPTDISLLPRENTSLFVDKATLHGSEAADKNKRTDTLWGRITGERERFDLRHYPGLLSYFGIGALKQPIIRLSARYAAFACYAVTAVLPKIIWLRLMRLAV